MKSNLILVLVFLLTPALARSDALIDIRDIDKQLEFTLYVNDGLAEEKIVNNDKNSLKQIQRGKMIYMRFCSFCHGKNLQGQPQWHKPKPDGKMPAPPHDETGHTWHHADIVLFNITKYGLVPPYAPKGYQSDMPAWKDTLKDEDIWAVLAFIKSSWPKENREFQEKITESYKPF